MAETLFLVRHGEAESNVKRYFAGWSAKSSLTSLGKEQARLLHRRLAKEGIGKIFCSDLERTQETARLLGLKCPITYSASLRERNYGILEGVEWGSDEKKYEAYHSDPFIRPKGGENCADVQKRVLSYFKRNVLS
ncbi:MAG: histidine phosphatase family protein, partial [Candidatus Anstonellaceae archaeon]